MKKDKTVAFDSVHTVARYLFEKKNDLSPLKLQFCLYFLYAYYGAIIQNQKRKGLKSNSPDLLFATTFRAWKYGSHIHEVFEANKEGLYKNVKERKKAEKEVSKNPFIQKIIDELFHQIALNNDFTLLDRNHMDRCWKEAYLSETQLMDNEKIVEEYIEKYL